MAAPPVSIAGRGGAMLLSSNSRLLGRRSGLALELGTNGVVGLGQRGAGIGFFTGEVLVPLRPGRRRTG